jgi:hypothetical protein
VHNVELTEPLGIVEGKSLVMARSQSDIFTACGFCRFYDVSHTAGAEAFAQRLIILGGSFVNVVSPFTLSDLGIQTEVDEHTEAKLFKRLNIGQRGGCLFHDESPFVPPQKRHGSFFGFIIARVERNFNREKYF